MRQTAVLGLAILGLALVPAAAQAQPTQEQVQGFANRTAALMLAIEASRRCPGLDLVERAVADKLYEIDRGDLVKLNSGAGAALEGARAQHGSKPCDDPVLGPARQEGEAYAKVVTASAALVLRELSKCDAAAYFPRAKAWAATYQAPAGLGQHVTQLAAPVRAWAGAKCAGMVDSQALLSIVGAAAAAAELWRERGLPECLTVGGLNSWRPACAWKTPGPAGLVAGKVCNLSMGFFNREKCAYGFDAAGNLLLTYVWSIDSDSQDAVSEVALVVGGTRHATSQVQNEAGQRRTWRFPAAAAEALLKAPRTASVEDEATIPGATATTNVPQPAGDFQDALLLAKAMRGS